MFDFATETIVNSLSFTDINQNVKPRVVVQTNPLAPTEKLVNILQLGKFPKFNSISGTQTVGFYKVAPVAPVKETATLSLADLELADIKGHVLSLGIELILQGSQDGASAQFAVHKGDSFYTEYFVKSTDTLATIATAITAVANSAFTRGDRKLLNATVSGTTITFTATTPYQRFKAIQLVDVTSAYDDLSAIVAEGTVTLKGSEGAGNYWQLLKNLRLPTNEATRFGGTLQDERPVPGAQYVQYTLQLEAKRNFTGQSAVGQKLESKTNHTIFVLSTLATAFEAFFTDIIPSAGWVNPTSA